MRIRRKTPIFFLLMSVCILLFFSIPARLGASQSEQLVAQALGQIETAGPGQTVTNVYTTYSRMPPTYLEPTDPYHRPYTEIWSEYQVVTTTIEIGRDNRIERTRTQLVDGAGRLIQDLLFDGETEIGYFVLEGRAYRNPMELGKYQDENTASLKMIIDNLDPTPRHTIDPDGEAVLSVYTSPQPFQGTVPDLASALTSFGQPFIADLEPTSTASRMDFDLTSKFPVGEGTVVTDKSGQEHLVTYRKLIKREIVQTTISSTPANFTQEIPNEAFADSVDLSAHVKTLVGMDEIRKNVSYPLYGLSENGGDIRLVAASLAIPQAEYRPPGYLSGILYVPSVGPGVNTIYSDVEYTGVLSVIQGPTEEMKTVLQETSPDWTRSEFKKMLLGDQPVDTWVLYPLDFGRFYLVMDAGDTILYIDSRDMSFESVAEVLGKFVLLDQAHATFKAFLPVIQAK